MRYHRNEIHTGKILESQYLGSPAEVRGERRETPYLSYRIALETVKNTQRGDPTDPDARFARDLHATLAEKICPDDYGKLRFFTAVDSALDHFHGIDAFFEHDSENGSTEIVTIDLTTNPHKELKVSKADRSNHYVLFIDLEYDDLDDPVIRKAFYDRVTSEIASIFLPS